MSASTFADVFAPVEARYRAQVEAATWGHLAPKAQTTYRCTILFAHGEYGDLIPVRVNTPDLPDSPWFFQDMMDFLWKQKRAEGGVYEFVGTYRKCKTGRAIFKGYIATRISPPDSNH